MFKNAFKEHNNYLKKVIMTGIINGLMIAFIQEITILFLLQYMMMTNFFNILDSHKQNYI